MNVEDCRVTKRNYLSFQVLGYITVFVMRLVRMEIKMNSEVE